MFRDSHRLLGTILLLLGCSQAGIRGRDVEARAVWKAHKAFVSCVAFSPDGKTIASGDDGGTVLLWDSATGKKRAVLEGHHERVLSLSFSPDGKRLVSGGFDGIGRMWNVAEGKLVTPLKGHKGWINVIRYAPDGKSFLTGSFDKTIRVWDANTGKALKTISTQFFAASALAFTPDGKALAVGTISSKILIMDYPSGESKMTFNANGSVLSLAYTNDGKSLVVAAGNLANVEDKPELKVWNTETGTDRLTFQGHKKTVWSLVVSPDQTLLLTASFDGTAKLWDIRTGKALFRFVGSPSKLFGVDFSPNGKTVVGGGSDRAVRLWDVPKISDVASTVPGMPDPVGEVSETVAEKQLVGLINRASALERQSKNDESLEAFKKALAYYQKMKKKEPLSHAIIASSMAGLYVKRDEWDQAKPLYEQGIESASRSKHAKALKVRALIQLEYGQKSFDRKEMKRAALLFVEVLEAFPEDPQISLLVNFPLRQLYLSQSKTPEGVEVFRAVLAARKGKPDPAGLVPRTQFYLARLYKQMEKYTEAEPLFRSAVEAWNVRPEDDDLRPLAKIALADISHATERIDDAEKMYRALCMKQPGQSLPEQRYQLLALLKLLRVYGEAGKVRKAIALTPRVKGFRNVKSEEETLLVVLCLIHLVGYHHQQEDFDTVESLIYRTLEMAEAHFGKKHRQSAWICSQLGHMCYVRGDAVRANPLIQRAIEIFEELEDEKSEDLAIALSLRSGIYFSRGEYTKAEADLTRGIGILERADKDDPQLLQMRISLLRYQHLVGKELDKKVVDDLERQVKRLVPKTKDDLLTLVPIYFTLAGFYHDQGRSKEAIALVKEQFDRVERALGSDHFLAASALSLLAQFTFDDPDSAIKYCRRSVALLEKRFGPRHLLISATFLDMARLYIQKGDAEGAVEVMKQARERSVSRFEGDRPGTGELLCELGLLHILEGNWKAGLAEMDEGTRLRSKFICDVLPALPEGEQIRFLRLTEQNYLHTSLSAALSRPNDNQLANLSACWLINGKGIALTSLMQRQVLARKSRNPKVNALFREWLSVRHEIAALQLKSFSKERQEERTERLQQLWTRHAELMKLIGHGVTGLTPGTSWVELDRVRKALGKDEVLVEVLRMPVRNLDKEGEPWLPARYVAWVIPPAGPENVTIVDLGSATDLDKAIRAFRKDMKEAERLIPALGEAVGEKSIRERLAEVAKPIVEKLLPHIRGKKRWVVSPDGELWLIPWEALPLDEKSYAIEHYSFRYVLSGRDVLVPKPGLKLGPPMIVANPDFELDPRMVLTETDRLLRRTGAKLEVGKEVRPAYQLLPRRWGRLEGSAREAETLTPLLEKLSGVKPIVRLDNQALEGVVRTAVRPHTLVLSTHGFFLEPDLKPPAKPRVQAFPIEDDPFARPRRRRRRTSVVEEKLIPIPNSGERVTMEDHRLLATHPALTSGVVLAGANSLVENDRTGEDGLLTGWEIAGMDLRGTRLVVLSACETGLGRVQAHINHVSVVGLRQALLVAGARKVVSTLWRVPDTETAELMGTFFRRLSQKQSETDAMRNAQLEMIAHRRKTGGAAHPFFWAPFTLTVQGNK